MQLDRLTVAMRERTAREAMDLGFALARSSAREVYVAWLVFVLPVVLLANFVFVENATLAYLAVWWLKPLYDAVVLSVVSRTLVGDRPSLGQLVLEAPRVLQRHLWADLTWRRLSPWRSYLTPVRHLEGARGKLLAERQRAIAAFGREQGAQLQFVCWIFELGLAFSMYAFVEMIAPAGSVPSPFARIADGDGNVLMDSTILFLALTAVEPFYVAAGFTLYLNRRVELEGWDLELIFRRLASRVGPRGVVAPAAALLIMLGAGAAQAQERSPRQVATEVLQSDEFQAWRDVSTWSYIEDGRPAQPAPELPRWDTGGAVARTLPWLFGVTLLTALVHGLLVLRQRQRAGPVTGAVEERASVERSRAPLVDPKSLPPDVAAASRAAWERGQTELALSLLFRGALVNLSRAHSFSIAGSATELECVRLVRGHVGAAEAVRAFEAIARAWQAIAYASRVPGGDEFASLHTAFVAHCAPPPPAPSEAA